MNKDDYYLVSGYFFKLTNYVELSFGLNPDRHYNFMTWKYPVVWSGHVGGKYVSLVQTSESTNDIDFSSVPIEMISAVAKICSEIEYKIKCLKS